MADGPDDGFWVDAGGGIAGRGDARFPLSRQEVALLAALASVQGRVVARAELARRAGLTAASARRCDQLLIGIRRALGPDAVRTVRGRGWILTVPVAEHTHS